jgi:hypothetical protein
MLLKSQVLPMPKLHEFINREGYTNKCQHLILEIYWLFLLFMTFHRILKSFYCRPLSFICADCINF